MPTATVAPPALGDMYTNEALVFLKNTDLNLPQISKDTGFNIVVQRSVGTLYLSFIVPPQRKIVYYKQSTAYATNIKPKPYWIPLPWMIYHVKIIGTWKSPFQFAYISMSRTKPTVTTPSSLIRRFPDPNVGCLGGGQWSVDSIERIFSELIPRYWSATFNNDNGIILTWFRKLAADRLGTTEHDIAVECANSKKKRAKYTAVGFQQWESLKWRQLQQDKQLFANCTDSGFWIKDRFSTYDLTIA